MGASERLYHSQGRECGLGGLPGKRSRDAFPVSPYHTLIIPKRHVLDYFGLKQPEINAINRLLTDQRAALQNADLTIDDFNVGMNCGETAVQSVFHCHVHLIPRSEAIWRDNIYRARIIDIANCVAAWLSGSQRIHACVQASDGQDVSGSPPSADAAL
jgi:diadenosine tetraphosphate (Ap4A) HIT family hydrolase